MPWRKGLLLPVVVAAAFFFPWFLDQAAAGRICWKGRCALNWMEGLTEPRKGSSEGSRRCIQGQRRM